MPPRSSRSLNAPLDPYGIYGTRTANRLRSSRKRRQSHAAILCLCIAALMAGVYALAKWKRVDTRFADAVFETGMNLRAAPIWAQSPSGDALLLAGEDGRLLRLDEPDKNDFNNPKTAVLMQADFPLGAPLVTGETAYVPCQDGTLLALAWREKKLLWRARVDDSLTARPTAYSIGKKQVVAAASDAGLIAALDAATGATLWRARLPAPVGEALTAISINGKARLLVPLLGGVAMRGGVWCLDGASGKVLWRFPKDARAEAIQFAAPIADEENNRAYIANDYGAIAAVNLTMGIYDSKKSIGWKTFVRPARQADPDQVVVLRAMPLVINSAQPANNGKLPAAIVIVGGNDGLVRGLSAADGSLRWEFECDAPIISLSEVRISDSQKFVLVASRSARFVLLDANNGAVVRHFSSRGSAFVGATASTQNIFAATEDGAIHRFALPR